MEFPLDRWYYKKHSSHVWFKNESGKIKIGLDAFLAKNAGYLNFISVDRDEAVHGESLGSYESAKFVSKYYSPVSGPVTKVNEMVVSNPRKINDDPYGSWIVEINPTQLEHDLSSDDVVYEEKSIKEWIEDEVKRLDAEEE
jgi:glycine cleavage system H protein